MPSTAAQIDWGSPVDSVLRDSFGVPLDDTFVVQLGFFESVLGIPFDPSAGNAAEWADHWKVFDQAAYNPKTGYFTSSALLLANGSSSSPFASTGVNFSNQDAYVWIYNSTAPGPLTQWFLGRNYSGGNAWTLPNQPVDCCDNQPPLEWSISDLGSGDVPVYGKQGGIAGEGDHTDNGIYDLQTFTVVPEPSVALLAACGGLILVLHRRRTSGSKSRFVGRHL